MKKNPSKEYADKINTYMESHWQFNNHLDHDRHQKRILFASSFCLPINVLEVGVANGYSTALMQDARQDCNFFGIEPTDWGFEQAKKLLKSHRVFKAYAENMPFKDKQFDSVVLPEVIEHCEDPVAVLNECLRVTKNRLIVTHPVDEAGMNNDPTHVRYYSFKDMRKQIEEIVESNNRFIIKNISHAGLDRNGNVIDTALHNEHKIFFGLTIIDKG